MEVISLRDAAEDLEKLKVRVLGISLDDVKTQKSFCKAQKLNFDLLSDAKGEVAKKYHALMKGRPYAKRMTFVIGPNGKIRSILQRKKLKVRTHGKDLVTLITKLQKEKK